MTEREVKLALPGRFVIPPLSLGDAALDVEALPELTLRATYFDTLDLRLARHGVTLRYRTGEPTGPMWTVKLPVATDGAELVQDEIHLEGGRQEPPPLARSLVTAFAQAAAGGGRDAADAPPAGPAPRRRPARRGARRRRGLGRRGPARGFPLP